MIERYTLKNGIPLFVVPSSSSPVVSIQAWISRGSIHESDSLAGISHFLEHALFKGTKKRKVGEIALEIESRGGEINAFTSYEETVYYTTLASRYFEEGLDVIADAVQHPSFDSQEMDREREVILEEIKRANDSPSKILYQSLWKTQFPKTPYGRPVLGFEKTVRNINASRLRKYFTDHYHAGSISLFVVGDIDPRVVHQHAEKKFQSLPRRKRVDSFKAIKIPKHKNPLYVVNARDVKETHILLGYPAPPVTSEDTPAFDLACMVFGQGESSRLYQRLIKEVKVSLDAQMTLVATSHCGLASLWMLAPPEQLESSIREYTKLVTEVCSNGIERSELDRIRKSFESEVVYGKETVEGYARRLGYYYIQFGDPDYEQKYLDRLLDVTLDETSDALAKLVAEAPVLSIVHPFTTTVNEKDLMKALSTAPIKRRARSTATKALPEKVIKRGVTFITRRLDSLPVISLRFLFGSGSRHESKDKCGLGNLFQRVWTSGTKSYHSLEITRSLESLGATLHAFCGKNTCGLSAEFLSKQWASLEPLLDEILFEPTFPEEEFQIEKDLVIREILAAKDSPSGLCHRNFLETLYGDHPYGMPQLGRKETVERLTSQDLRRFFQDQIHAGHLVISTVGDFDPKSWVETLVNKSTRLRQNARGGLTNSTSVKALNEIRVKIEIKKPLFQSHLMIGFLGASYEHKERFALKLLSSYLSGQGGRLFLELRDKKSLAYQVAPMNSDGPERGYFGFYIGCSPEKLEQSISEIRLEVERVLKIPLKEGDLRRAREYWIGRFELEMQRYSSQSMLYGLDEILGLGFRHYLDVPEMMKSISHEDILVAAHKFLTPEHVAISVVHDKHIDSDQIVEAWGRSVRLTTRLAKPAFQKMAGTV